MTTLAFEILCHKLILSISISNQKNNAELNVNGCTLKKPKNIVLEPTCCKKWQKNPHQETGSGNRGRLKVLNDTKLVLNELE